MQDDVLRHHLIVHASRLDTFSKIRGEVRDIASAREAEGGVASMQSGAVKGKDVKGKGKGELMEAEKERDDAKKLAEKNKDKPYFYCQKERAVKREYRRQQSITNDEITGA